MQVVFHKMYRIYSPVCTDPINHLQNENGGYSCSWAMILVPLSIDYYLKNLLVMIQAIHVDSTLFDPHAIEHARQTLKNSFCWSYYAFCYFGCEVFGVFQIWNLKRTYWTRPNMYSGANWKVYEYCVMKQKCQLQMGAAQFKNVATTLSIIDNNTSHQYFQMRYVTLF